jgi:hypothetical protein
MISACPRSPWDGRAHRRYDRAVPPSDDRFRCVPNWSLRRWAARVPGQLLACLANRDARPAGGRADVGDRREHGVLPEVVGLPPGDLIKQVRFGSPVDSGRGKHCVLELCVPAAARRVHSGRNRSRSPSRAAVRPGWPRTSPAPFVISPDGCAQIRLIWRLFGRRTRPHMPMSGPAHRDGPGCCFPGRSVDCGNSVRHEDRASPAPDSRALRITRSGRCADARRRTAALGQPPSRIWMCPSVNQCGGFAGLSSRKG